MAAWRSRSDGAPWAPQITDFRYDTLGRQTRVVYPDSVENPDAPSCSDCVQMLYDLAGRMTQRTDQRQQTTGFAYDDRGLPFQTTLAYDERGLLLSSRWAKRKP